MENTEEKKSSSKKKQIAPACRWCFTLNNYSEADINILYEFFTKDRVKKYIFEREIGEECGTPHLQGFVSFKKKLRPLSLKLNPKIHWEKARGSDQDNFNYCTTDSQKPHGEVWSGGWPEEVFVYPMELEWQKNILDIIAQKPCRRTIYWIWSSKGGMRKTETCRYLCVKHNAHIFGGKASDVRNGINNYFKHHGKTPELIVMNIPRSFSKEYVSYEAMENIKDMIFYSGKYGDGKDENNGMVVGNPPHLFVFANYEPPIGDDIVMSDDRWVVKNLDEGTDRFV